jgi:hypothetical protein
MAEENGTQVATQETGSEGSPIDQTSFINDAWDKGYFHSHDAELNPKVAQSKAEPPKAPIEKQAEPPKDPNAQVKQPDKQEPQKSRFEQAFAGEDGEIDVDKFMNFSLPTMKTEPISFEADKSSQSTTPEKEPWEKDMEEVTGLQNNLKTEVLDPLQKVADLISQGKDPIQALEEIYAERKAAIDQHINEVKSQKEFQRQKTLKEELLSQKNEEIQSKQSAVNTNEIISALPGSTQEEKTSLFHEVLFGNDVGAKVLDYHFDKAFPDNKKMLPEQRKVAATKFINGITSNKADLRFVFEQCLDKMTRSNLPKIMAKARMSALAADKANRLSAQKGPVSNQPRTQPSAAKGQWDNYLTSHYQAADRI